MGYLLRPGGYEDNQRLNDAMRANTAARRIVERILVERPDRGLLYQFLAELAHALGDELEAHTAMERIRLKTREVPGLPPDTSPTDDDDPATGHLP